MYAIVSHIPSDDINCPGIEMGPAATTKDAAIEGWKEARLTAYEESGAKDPEWDEDQPDSTEGLIMDLASGLRAKVQSGAPLPIYEFGDGEQAYLVEIPALPDHIAPGSETTAPSDLPGDTCPPSHIYRYADLSTGHLDFPTADALTNPSEADKWVERLVYMSRDHGWFVHIPTDYVDDADYEEIPQCLRDCFDFARKDGALWILFDCDAETVEGLRAFEW